MWLTSVKATVGVQDFRSLAVLLIKTFMKQNCKTMKTNNFLSALTGFMMLAAGIVATSCSTGDDGEDKMGYLDLPDASSGDFAPNGGASDHQNDNTPAGIVTAGEWNDLDHWAFWSRLMTDTVYDGNSDYWECYTNHRVAIEVSNGADSMLAGIPVKLVRTAGDKQTTLWEAVTDCHGRADCWLSLWQKSETVDASTLRVSIDGQLMDKQPVVCGWDSLGQLITNRYVCEQTTTVRLQADIAFVVDATGSMSDEINFLKSDLLDIIGKVEALRPSMEIRTSALFYRDEGDDYLTRHSDFTTDVSKTTDFVKAQKADGGGDYPEAVHTALECMLQNLNWSSQARTRIAFLILDAPAHHKSDVILSLQKSVQECARQGIRLIPVAASGADKGTEFMLRFFAIATGGTYVFLTDDSGVGLSHIQASVGDYEVEKLNELIIRLISYYTE